MAESLDVQVRAPLFDGSDAMKERHFNVLHNMTLSLCEVDEVVSANLIMKRAAEQRATGMRYATTRGLYRILSMSDHFITQPDGTGKEAFGRKQFKRVVQ